MTPHPERNDRLAAVRDLLRRLKLDGVLVSDRHDVRYLSGFRGDDATVVVGPSVAIICTDSRFWAQVDEEVQGFDLVKVDSAELMAESVQALAERSAPGASLGFQGSVVSYADYRALRRRHEGGLRNVGARLSRLRMVKDAEEIAALRRAAALADAALERVVAHGLVGRSEREVAWHIRGEMHTLGAEDESFATIVAGGAHGAQAHAIPGERRIARDELVVIDTGARVEGYCSDITRTFATGKVGGELRRVYGIVLAAQLAALAAVRDGAHGQRDVDAAARAVIVEAGYGEQFGHGTGHGVGLEIHEGPALAKTRGDRLRPGMVCTVEPGIYLEGRAGVRIEDTVLVTDDGCEPLTRFDKELRVVD